MFLMDFCCFCLFFVFKSRRLYTERYLWLDTLVTTLKILSIRCLGLGGLDGGYLPPI